jgi:hypothetical protein
MMSERRSTMLPPPSVPDEDEVYLADLTPLESMAVFADDDDMPTIPAPPPEHITLSP